jgi:hypothetical protein
LGGYPPLQRPRENTPARSVITPRCLCCTTGCSTARPADRR